MTYLMNSLRPISAKPLTKRNKYRNQYKQWLSFSFGPMCVLTRCRPDTSSGLFLMFNSKSSSPRPLPPRYLLPPRPSISTLTPGPTLWPYFAIAWRRLYYYYMLKYHNPARLLWFSNKFTRLKEKATPLSMNTLQHKKRPITSKMRKHPSVKLAKLNTRRQTIRTLHKKITVKGRPFNPSTLHLHTQLAPYDHTPRYASTKQTNYCKAKIRMLSTELSIPASLRPTTLRQIETTLMRSCRRSPLWKSLTRNGSLKVKLHSFVGRMTHRNFTPNSTPCLPPPSGTFSVHYDPTLPNLLEQAKPSKYGQEQMETKPTLTNITKKEYLTNPNITVRARLMVTLVLSVPDTIVLPPGQLTCTNEFLQFANLPTLERELNKPLSLLMTNPFLAPIITLWVFYHRYLDEMGARHTSKAKFTF